MTLVLEADVLPLNADPQGVVRVSGTRVTLDTLVGFYRQGYSAEQLHASFPTVPLADVHAVVAYYLRHREAVEAYLAEWARRTEVFRRECEARQVGLKERLERRLELIRGGMSLPQITQAESEAGLGPLGTGPHVPPPRTGKAAGAGAAGAS